MNKLLLIAALGIASFGSLTCMGQDSLYSRNRKTLTIGVLAGGRYMFNSPLVDKHFPKTKVNPCCRYTEGMFLKRYISEHLAIESGFSYMVSDAPTPTMANRTTLDRTLRAGKEYTITIPATAQYYIRPSKAKLNYFVGGGVNYNYNTQVTPSKPESNTKAKKTVTNTANLAVVQGIIYEVNTKIQVRESIHFIPSGQYHCQEVGFNIGVGYKF